ncbi:hypothetical protein GMA92_12670 [Turicibacter sanguinis]|uniref:Uncharacterized protein n=2 Tax=Turicibacter sanguinis TaxID=154288 RepID=A0A9X4XFZ1_9FIRM|nr:hypothetical protein [Turicibacter sanguinis]MTK73768.1 hypothetical protein [Turicibacter sanguinis]
MKTNKELAVDVAIAVINANQTNVIHNQPVPSITLATILSTIKEVEKTLNDIDNQRK